MIAIILAAAVALTLIVLVMLNWETIVNWFRAREELKESDKDNIAFTLQEKLTNGNYSTVQGIFNKHTNTVEDGVKYKSEDIDEEVAKAHRKESLVIYN